MVPSYDQKTKKLRMKRATTISIWACVGLIYVFCKFLYVLQSFVWFVSCLQAVDGSEVLVCTDIHDLSVCLHLGPRIDYSATFSRTLLRIRLFFLNRFLARLLIWFLARDLVRFFGARKYSIRLQYYSDRKHTIYFWLFKTQQYKSLF